MKQSIQILFLSSANLRMIALCDAWMMSGRMMRAKFMAAWLGLVVAAVSVALVASPSWAQEFAVHEFARQRLTETYFSEGTAVGDLNGDGVKDVVYGPRIGSLVRALRRSTRSTHRSRSRWTSMRTTFLLGSMTSTAIRTLMCSQWVPGHAGLCVQEPGC